MEMNNPLTLSMFLIVRLVGISALVPLVEELFWRCFLLRWTIDPSGNRYLWDLTWPSCLMVTAMFTLAHPEWFAAAGYCFMINGLLYWKKDLGCAWSPTASNFILAVYVQPPVTGFSGKPTECQVLPGRSFPLESPSPPQVG